MLKFSYLFIYLFIYIFLQEKNIVKENETSFEIFGNIRFVEMGISGQN